MSTALEVVELCAGAGGQSLGLHLAGFDHRLAVEIDADAAATLEANLTRVARQPRRGRSNVVVGDITDPTVWNPDEHVGVDLLAAGVPCPPFSIAGRQLGAHDERDLYAWTVGLVGRMRPRALLVENVAGLASSRFSAYRQFVADVLTEHGYVADWRLLHACDFGVPQLRPRYVLVALPGATAPFFEWPTPTTEQVTVGDAIGDLMAADGWAGASRWTQQANSVAPTLVGGSKKHGGPDLGPTRARGKWTALGVDGRGIADTAPSADAPLDHVPRLTTRMAERIQGFDSSPATRWEFLGRKTSRYRQIGNAFPPPVAAAVGWAIRAALERAAATDIGSPGPKPATVHDPVFAFLTHRSHPATMADMTHLGTPTHVRRALANLARDFPLQISDAHGDAAYLLTSRATPASAFRTEDRRTA